MQTVDGKSEFTYNRTGQLIAVDTLIGSGAMPEEDFSFDASGNRDSGDYTVSSDNRMSQSPPGRLLMRKGSASSHHRACR